MSDRYVWKHSQLDESERRIYRAIHLLRMLGWTFLIGLILAGVATVIWDKRKHFEIRWPKTPVELKEAPKGKFALSEMG